MTRIPRLNRVLICNHVYSTVRSRVFGHLVEHGLVTNHPRQRNPVRVCSSPGSLKSLLGTSSVGNLKIFLAWRTCIARQRAWLGMMNPI